MRTKAVLLAGLLASTSIFSCYSAGYVESEPPAVVVEARIAAPSPNAIWIDGYWTWRHGDWLWVSGYWERYPRGVWIAGYWERRSQGHYWVPGHWEKKQKHHNRDERRRAYRRGY